MRRKSQQINAQMTDVDRQPSAAGGGIYKQRDAACAGQFGHLGHRLNGTEVVASMMQANKDSIISYRLAKRDGVDLALAIDVDLRAAEAVAF